MTDREILCELADRVEVKPITGKGLAQWFYCGRQTAQNEPSGRMYRIMREVREANLSPEALAEYLRVAAHQQSKAF